MAMQQSTNPSPATATPPDQKSGQSPDLNPKTVPPGGCYPDANTKDPGGRGVGSLGNPTKPFRVG